MNESIFDPSWYRVASLRPQIRMHGQIHKHKYREKIWYVLQDHASNRFHRFSPEAYFLIKLMNGENTIQTLFDTSAEKLGDDAPTQTEIIQILGQLYSADMMQCDISPDTTELFKRYEKQEKQKLKQTLKTPLAIRIPFIDPDRFLEKYTPYIKPFFSLLGFIMWLAIVIAASILAGLNWVELTENVSDRVLAPQNMVLLWLIFPLIKALHELGHGFATKVWGGEVHEMGLMLLVFMPVPYVDASSASAFREQKKRIIVGAAGMLVEVFLASIAMFVWVAVEPGMIKSIAFNIMLIAGISTVLFNGNPLLRFDGYYIFSDMVEIQNLASRSNKYIMYLLQKHLYGVKDIITPASSDGERRWFLFFSIASFFYRMIIYFSIIFFIAGKFFFIGILLAFWAITTMFITPLYKGLVYLFQSNELNQKRSRALAYTSSIVAVLFLFLFVIPMPWHTVSEGVIWAPEKSTVRMGASAFIDKVLVKHGEKVTKGQSLIICKDDMLSLQIKKKKYELVELRAQQRAFRQSDLVQADILKDEIERVRYELNYARKKEGELIVRATADGDFFVARIDDLPGKFVNQGEPVGYIIYDDVKIVRVVVAQNEVDLIRSSTENVEVRLVTDVTATLNAVIKREVPSGSKELPSATLSGLGGGAIAVDPRAKEKLTTFERVFQFDIKINEDGNINNIGSRVYVRFYHGLSPLAYRWYKSLKQLLLRSFNV